MVYDSLTGAPLTPPHPEPRTMNAIITTLQSIGMTREHAIAWCAAELVKAGKDPAMVLDFMFGAGTADGLASDVYDQFAAA